LSVDKIGPCRKIGALATSSDKPSIEMVLFALGTAGRYGACMNQPLYFVPKKQLATVRAGCVVVLKYALFDADTDELLEFRDNFSYLHRGLANGFLKFQDAVEGLGVGMKTQTVLDVDEAFGPRRDHLAFTIELSALPSEAQQKGARVTGADESGEEIEFRVIDVSLTHALLDANHSFAGRRLKFVIEVIDIRPATEMELSQGHAVALTRQNTPEPVN
jgi:FKBP-type peptidyl-prolyl cis-trans isomerase SlyD